MASVCESERQIQWQKERVLQFWQTLSGGLQTAAVPELDSPPVEYQHMKAALHKVEVQFAWRLSMFNFKTKQNR